MSQVDGLRRLSGFDGPSDEHGRPVPSELQPVANSEREVASDGDVVDEGAVGRFEISDEDLGPDLDHFSVEIRDLPFRHRKAKSTIFTATKCHLCLLENKDLVVELTRRGFESQPAHRYDSGKGVKGVGSWRRRGLPALA